MKEFMPEIIFFMSVALLILGMFRCEIDSWRDRPVMRMPFSAWEVDMTPFLLDLALNDCDGLKLITIKKGRSISVSTELNMNDCFLKQQLKPESEEK